MTKTTDFFDRLRVRKSVLTRTTKRKELPEAVLYLEWLSGESRRRCLDAERKEHLLTDDVVQSNYKLVSGGQAKKLIASHWTEDVGAPQKPVRKES
jgi:hypothetical protein